MAQLINRTGRQADNFELSSLANRQVRLIDLKGAWVWMVFHRHLG